MSAQTQHVSRSDGFRRDDAQADRVSRKPRFLCVGMGRMEYSGQCTSDEEGPPGCIEAGKAGPEEALYRCYMVCVKPFRALTALKLHLGAIVKSPVAIHFDGGMVYEDILPGTTLNKSVTLCCVEPLNESDFLHHATPWELLNSLLPRPAFMRTNFPARTEQRIGKYHFSTLSGFSHPFGRISRVLDHRICIMYLGLQLSWLRASCHA
jgi:hypothetical protein